MEAYIVRRDARGAPLSLGVSIQGYAWFQSDALGSLYEPAFASWWGFASVVISGKGFLQGEQSRVHHGKLLQYRTTTGMIVYYV